MEGADLFSYEKLQARPTITEDELTTLLGVDRKHIHPYDSNKTLEEIMDYLVHIKNNK
ncbi:MAG: hypothetical protein BWY21_02157 [Parcubacteria group bacterium ADurb.Bin216]|nr:MAG: hypothetical protein BWY21_02157 [Parcubacteria group bacterium ADurb.Bin216]